MLEQAASEGPVAKGERAAARARADTERTTVERLRATALDKKTPPRSRTRQLRDFPHGRPGPTFTSAVRRRKRKYMKLHAISQMRQSCNKVGADRRPVGLQQAENDLVLPAAAIGQQHLAAEVALAAMPICSRRWTRTSFVAATRFDTFSKHSTS